MVLHIQKNISRKMKKTSTFAVNSLSINFKFIFEFIIYNISRHFAESIQGQQNCLKIRGMQRLSMEIGDVNCTQSTMKIGCDNISYQLRSILQCVFFVLSLTFSLFLPYFLFLSFSTPNRSFISFQFLFSRIFQIEVIVCASLFFDCQIELDKIDNIS